MRYALSISLTLLVLSLSSCDDVATKKSEEIVAASSVQDPVKTVDVNSNWILIQKVEGDLNGDGKTDRAMVTQDTSTETALYRLQIDFLQKDGTYKTEITTNQAIQAQYPEGREGWVTGNSFDRITIEGGSLKISEELTRGNFNHKFKYANGHFELIEYHFMNSDGHGSMEFIDFYLTSGDRRERVQDYTDNDKVITDTRTVKKIDPLPKLQDFKPFEEDLY